jgi:hypothetical protein
VIHSSGSNELFSLQVFENFLLLLEAKTKTIWSSQ